MPKSRQFKRFLPPKPEMQQLTRLLLQFYVTIFGHFRGKSQKIWFYKALDGKNSSISSPDRIFNSWKGFYCVFMRKYLEILREKAKKKIFWEALEGKNTSISSPDRIFNSWQGFYCSFMWQYFGIWRRKSQKKLF